MSDIAAVTCSECGKAMSAGTSTCRNCGAPVVVEAASNHHFNTVSACARKIRRLIRAAWRNLRFGYMQAERKDIIRKRALRDSATHATDCPRHATRPPVVWLAAAIVFIIAGLVGYEIFAQKASRISVKEQRSIATKDNFPDSTRSPPLEWATALPRAATHIRQGAAVFLVHTRRERFRSTACRWPIHQSLELAHRGEVRLSSHQLGLCVRSNCRGHGSTGTGDGHSIPHACETDQYFRRQVAVRRESRSAAATAKGGDKHSSSSIPGETYSSEIDDIDSMGMVHGITPIGDLGDIQFILDLGGFIPLSAASKRKMHRFWRWDVFQWYKIPLIAEDAYNGPTSRRDSLDHVIPLTAGIAYLYYGTFDDATRAKLSKIKLLTEDELINDNLQWAKLSYGLARSSGRDLFASVTGSSSGFVGAEPVVVLLTQRSAFVLMSFRYSDMNRAGATGQVLCCFEFSRTLKEYKSYCEIYSTQMLNRGANKAFNISTPYIAKAVEIYFFGN